MCPRQSCQHSNRWATSATARGAQDHFIHSVFELHVLRSGSSFCAGQGKWLLTCISFPASLECESTTTPRTLTTPRTPRTGLWVIYISIIIYLQMYFTLATTWCVCFNGVDNNHDGHVSDSCFYAGQVQSEAKVSTLEAAAEVDAEQASHGRKSKRQAEPCCNCTVAVSQVSHQIMIYQDWPCFHVPI